MGPRGTSAITELLQAWRRSEEVADDLLALVYIELRRVAARLLRRERDGHALQPGDLVSEAYLRLKDQRQADWQDRGHFYAASAQAMRRILIDHARREAASKRIHPSLTIPLDQAPDPVFEHDVEVLALDEALTRLAERRPQQAQIVELRAFAGMTLDEIAEIVGMSRSAIHRDWRTATLWLRREMTRRAGSLAVD
ncbi:MAG: ECF-type sigma factor [Acidobacteriota bacterium]